MGMGPMTGRGAGYCAGFAAPGYANPSHIGCGSRGGHGFRRMFYATGLPGWARSGYSASAATHKPAAEEKELLNQQASFLENWLEQIKRRLSDLKESAE